MTKCSHVIKGHIIRKNEENIGFCRASIRSQQGQDSSREEKERSHGRKYSCPIQKAEANSFALPGDSRFPEFPGEKGPFGPFI